MAREAFLYINGEEIPTPSRGLEVIISTAVNSGRNAENVVIGERVGRDTLKYNNLTWKWLTNAQWKKICGLFKNSFFVVAKVWSPADGKFVKIKIYPGDRSGQPYWIDNDKKGEPIAWTDCKVNIIDTNKMWENW